MRTVPAQSSQLPPLRRAAISRNDLNVMIPHRDKSHGYLREFSRKNPEKAQSEIVYLIDPNLGIAPALSVRALPINIFFFRIYWKMQAQGILIV